MAVRAYWQKCAKLIGGTSRHRRPGDHVLADGLAQEMFRGNDAALARIHLFARSHTQNPTEVVGVRMRVDHCGHWKLFDMLVDEPECCACGEFAGEWINNNPALIAPNKCDVGDVITAHLPHTRNHFKQTVMSIQRGVPPQVGVDRVGRLFTRAQKVVGTNVEHHTTRGRLDGG